MATVKQKFELLKAYISDVGKDGAVIAFSGGVDSSTLAAISHMILGQKAIAIIAQSPIRTSKELLDAKKTAKNIGIQLYTIQTNELSNPNFTVNPKNRCYYCKKDLLTNLKHLANQLGFKTIFEGTNHSDLHGYRPGYLAIQEIPDVFSPWVSCKFNKDEIRQLAKQLGLNNYDKPPITCLATRISYNQNITIEKLVRIEHAEQTIETITGAKQIRVRDHEGLARIEIQKTEFPLLCNITLWNQIAEELTKLGFNYVTLDLQGYLSGSMLKTLKN